MKLIYSLQKENDSSETADFNNMVELIENNLHSVIEELERWQSIIGKEYIESAWEKRRKSLVNKP